MKKAALGLSVFLTLALPALAADDLPPDAQAQSPAPDVVDDREASFMRPPAALLPLASDAAKKQEAAAPAPAAPIAAAPVAVSAPVAPASVSNVNKKVEAAPAPLTQPPVPAVATAPVAMAPVAVPAVSPASPLPAAPATPTPVPAAPAVVEPVPMPQPVAAAPLAEVDPESMGLRAPSNGGLGASIWKDTSRLLVDRLMPTVGLPSSSATLNELALRLFLSTAAAPVSSGGEAKPARSLLAQRIEALMALGAVSDAWKMAMLADPKLVDPVTLRQVTEASLIGTDSKEVCDKIPSLMAAHGKTEESGSEWQKSLLVCQLRKNDTKAVQLGVDMMRDQPTRDDLFLSLVSKNALGGGKQLPRQLTPLRPLNLAVLRQIGLPLPPELYARADAVLVPELLQTRSTDEKARIALAEKAAARGTLSSAQLAQAYKSVAFTPKDIEGAMDNLGVTPLTRAMAYQAALNEQSPSKKISLIQKVAGGLEEGALGGGHGDLVASLLDGVPLSAEQKDFAAQAARLYVLCGHPDKASGWLKLARESEATSAEGAAALLKNWPLYVLSALVPDGEYAQGFKGWKTSVLPTDSDDGNAQHEKREKAGRVMLVLSAAGFAIPDDAWVDVVEGAPPVKQVMPSPVLMERLKQAALAGRKGEVILLGLQMTGGGRDNESSFALLVEIVRSLRLVGLQAESQALAREVLVGLGAL